MLRVSPRHGISRSAHISSMERTSPLYLQPVVLLLTVLATGNSQTPEELGTFSECLELVTAAVSRMDNAEDRNLWHVFVIRLLRDQGLNNTSPKLRRQAIQGLTCLAMDLTGNGGWLGDREVFSEMLQALRDVHAWGENQKLATDALNVMTSVKDNACKAIVNEWLSGSSLGQKLKSGARSHTARSHNIESENVTKENEVIRIVEEPWRIAELRRHYYQCYGDDCATITSLDRGPRRCVKLSDYLVVCGEDNRADRSDPTVKRSSHRVGSHILPGRVLQRRLCLNSLFVDQSIDSNNSPQKVRKILLWGKPGSGKSTIAKTIAYNWAANDWGEQFDALYLLPARLLNRHAFWGYGRSKQVTIAVAVVNYYASLASKNHCKAIAKQVDEDLHRETTLLIIDGLHEADEFGKRMIRISFGLPCSLLVLSRENNLHGIRRKADFEVECLGLNDGLLPKFLKSVLPEAKSEKVLSFLAKNPILESAARTPALASVLAGLFSEGRIIQLDEKMGWSLLEVYKALVAALLQYMEPALSEKRTLIFEAIEEIALEACKNEKILINPQLMNRHSTPEQRRCFMKTGPLQLLTLDGANFRFIHSSFQEYFAGMCLARRMVSRNTAQYNEMKNFIIENRFSPWCERVVRFFSEEVCKQKGFLGFKKLVSVAEADVKHGQEKQLLLFKLELIDAFLASSRKITNTERSAVIAMDVVAPVDSLLKNFENQETVRWVIQKLSKLTTAVQHFPMLFRSLVECVENRNKPCRVDALDAIRSLISVVPKHAGSVLMVLSGLFTEEEDDTLRMQALSQSQILARWIPEEEINEIFILLAAGFRDASSAVSAQAYSQLADLAAAGRRICDRVMKLIEELCLDQEPRVRDDAWSLLCEIEKASQKHDYDVFGLAKRTCNPADAKTGHAAVRRLFKLAKSQNFQGQIPEYLQELTSYRSMDVRLEVFSELHSCLQENPAFARKCLELLGKGLEDNNSDVRGAVYSHLQSIAATNPQYHEVLLEIMKSPCQHEASAVRVDAARHLSGFAGPLCEYENWLLTCNESFLQDEADDVRMAMIDQTAELVRCIPNCRYTLLKQMHRACPDAIIGIVVDKVKHHDPETRASWAGLLADLAEEMPTHVDTLLKTSKHLFRDDSASVREKAFDACVAMADTSIPCAVSFLNALVGEIENHPFYGSWVFSAVLSKIVLVDCVLPHHLTKWSLETSCLLPEDLKKFLDISLFLLSKKTEDSSLDVSFSFRKNIQAAFLAFSLTRHDQLRCGKYSREFDIACPFLMQVFVEETGVDGFKFLMDLFNEEPVEVLGMQHFLKNLQLLKAALAASKNSDLSDLILKPKEPNELSESISSFVAFVGHQRHALDSIGPTTVQQEPFCEQEDDSMCTGVLSFSSALQTGCSKQSELGSDNLELWKNGRVYDEVGNLLATAGCIVQEEEASNVHEDLMGDAYSGDQMRFQGFRHRLEQWLEISSGLAKESDVLDSLETELKHFSEEVREEAVLQISHAFKTCDHSRLLELLFEAFEDASITVRFRAVRQALEILRDHPEYEDIIWQRLLKELCESDEAIKCHIVYQIGLSFHALKQENKSNVLDQLLEMCDDRSHVLRRAAVSTMSTAAKHLLESHETIEDLLEKRSEDKNNHVRNEAKLQLRLMRQSARALRDAPKTVEQPDSGIFVPDAPDQRVEEELDMLFKDCESQHVDLRIAAIERIPDVFLAARDFSVLILDLLQEGINDPADAVSIAAIQQLPRIMESAPDLEDEVVTLLRRGFEIGEKDVRLAVLQVTSQIAGLASGTDHGFAEFIQWGCDHEDTEVRSTAIKQIASTLRVENKESTNRLLSLLCDALEDNTEAVYLVALETLGRLQFKQLLELSWESEKEGIVFALSVKLLQVPLLAKKVGDLTVELAYLEAGQWVKEFKPLTKVWNLFSMIYSQLKKASPSLFAIPGFGSGLKGCI